MMGTTFSGASDVLSVKEYSHPSKADWSTAHAKATGCEFPAIVFMCRYWGFSWCLCSEVKTYISIILITCQIGKV